MADAEVLKETARKQKKRVMVGTVVSDKMNKTIVVSVARRKVHRLYKKYVNATKHVKAHDEEETAKVGDLVRVMEARPVSKTKNWRLVEVIERAR